MKKNRINHFEADVQRLWTLAADEIQLWGCRIAARYVAQSEAVLPTLMMRDKENCFWYGMEGEGQGFKSELDYWCARITILHWERTMYLTLLSLYVYVVKIVHGPVGMDTSGGGTDINEPLRYKIQGDAAALIQMN